MCREQTFQQSFPVLKLLQPVLCSHTYFHSLFSFSVSPSRQSIPCKTHLLFSLLICDQQFLPPFFLSLTHRFMFVLLQCLTMFEEVPTVLLRTQWQKMWPQRQEFPLRGENECNWKVIWLNCYLHWEEAANIKQLIICTITLLLFPLIIPQTKKHLN